MNEVQLIRQQIGIVREHVRVLSRNKNNHFSNAYDDYIIYALNQEQSRGAAHVQRLSAAGSSAPQEEAALAHLRHALDETAPLLEVATSHTARGSKAPATPERRAALLCNLIDSAERVEALAERRYTLEDWRSVARVDADSVLEERKLWAEVVRDGSGS